MRFSLAFVLLVLSLFAGCDNVARIWNRDTGSGGGGGGGNPDPATQITVPESDQIFRATRPSVTFAEPTGSGLPVTTPVVVYFDEPMNADSIREAQDEDDPRNLFVRARAASGGESEIVRGTYRFFDSNRVVVFTPATGFPSNTYEVVVGRDVIDLDRQVVQRTGVIAEFTTDGTSEAGLRIVAITPETRERSLLSSVEPLVILSGPVEESTVTSDSLFLQDDSNAKITAGIEYPVSLQGVNDTRFIRLDPTEALRAAATYRLSVTNDIQFEDVRLDIRGRNPLVQFTTIEPEAPSTIAIANTNANFPNAITSANLETLEVDVTLPASSEVGDTVLVRIYGFDANETANEIAFVEQSARVATAGAGVTKVSFAGELGSTAAPRFKEGSLTLLARVERAADATPALLLPNVLLDVTAPTVTTLGPPGTTTSIVTDLGFAAVTGTASEEIGRLELTVGSTTLALAGSDDDGRFWSQPVLLTRSATPVPFVMNLFDRAGNPVAGAINGNFVQRGFLAGDVSLSRTMTVSVYDETTLDVIAGARVVLEPGIAQKPSVGRQVETTSTAGTVSFSSLTAASHSITVVADGYELTSVLGTTGDSLSLPLRPRTNATSTVDATLTFLSGARSRVGVNILDDEALDYSVPTLSSSIRQLSGITVRPRRSLFTSGFAGQFPPASKPSFASGGTAIGATSSGRGRASAPAVSADGGEGPREIGFAMLPATQNDVPLFTNLAAPYTLDFGTSVTTGLDTDNLVEAPRVSFLLGLSGLSGLCYVGPGFVTGGPSSYTIDGSYSSAAFLDFRQQGPVLWASVIAQDRSGNISRNRALFSNGVTGAVARLVDPGGIPTITAPMGASTGSPLVTFADRLDSSVITTGGLALRTIRATDANGQRWSILSFDTDGAGGSKSVQIPDLSGSGLTGLRVGNWSIVVEDRLIVSPGFGTGALVLEDMPRLEATWARAAAVDFTVN